VSQCQMGNILFKIISEVSSMWTKYNLQAVCNKKVLVQADNISVSRLPPSKLTVQCEVQLTARPVQVTRCPPQIPNGPT
jgi:hypothetical protein